MSNLTDHIHVNRIVFMYNIWVNGVLIIGYINTNDFRSCFVAIDKTSHGSWFNVYILITRRKPH